MSPKPPQDDPHPLVLATQRKDRALRLRAVARTGGAVLALLLVLAATDYAASLPAWARWAGSALAAAALAAGFVQVRRILKSPTRVEDAARDVEAGQKGLGNEVVTAAEYLSGRRRPSNDTEAVIAAALSRRAARHVAEGTPDYRRRLAWPALAAMGAALLSLALFVGLAPAAWISLVRAAVPWSRASHTRIVPGLGSGEFPVGLALVVTNRIEGRMPRTAAWQQREAPGAPWQSVTLTVTNGVARHAFTVQRNVEWRLRAGDGVTDVFRLDAYTPPTATNFHVRQTPPSYTRLPSVVRQVPDIAAVRGTRAQWSLVANVPLSAASLRLTNGVVIPLRRDDDHRWSTEITVLTNTAFAIVLADASGRTGLDTGLRRIRALADAPPSIEVTRPGRDIRARPADVVPLEMVASDDFGVARVELVYHKLGGPEQRVPVPMGAIQDGKIPARLAWALAPIRAKEFEVVAYHAEARDANDVDGPGVGRSPEFFIEFNERPDAAERPQQGKPAGQKLNLLTVQKQIVADTAVLPSSPTKKATDALAQRQRDALEFARMYQQALQSQGAEPEASERISDAVAAMEQAAQRLEAADGSRALPPEEKALAALYQTLKAMPALRDLPMEKPGQPEESSQPPPPEASDSRRLVLQQVVRMVRDVSNRPVEACHVLHVA